MTVEKSMMFRNAPAVVYLVFIMINGKRARAPIR